MTNKKAFKSVNEDGGELDLAVLRPSPKQQVEAQLIYNKEWRTAEEAGCILRRDLDTIAEKRGMWSEENKAAVKELEDEIISSERRLRGGANSFDSLANARAVAIKLRRLRNERMELLNFRNDLYPMTAEYYAENRRFDYLVSAVTVDNITGKRYFKSYEDYLHSAYKKVSGDSLGAYLELLAEDIPQSNPDDDLYEEKFLRKYGFVDEKGRLVDSQNRLIDEDTGLLVNEVGRYLNDDGQLIDRDGNLVDEAGDPIIEFKEFSV